MTLSEVTTADLANELGRRAAVGAFIVLVGSPDAAELVRDIPNELNPVLVLHRIDRADQGRFHDLLRAVATVFNFEQAHYLHMHGTPPQ